MSLWDPLPIRSEMDRRAIQIWRAQQMMFPAFVRRMNPDVLDGISGAWDRVIEQAEKELRDENPVLALDWPPDQIR